MNVSVVSTAAQSAMASALQEAMETAAQTKSEAAKGDPQALGKMAKLNAQQVAPQAPAAVPPDGTGVVLNVQR